MSSSITATRRPPSLRLTRTTADYADAADYRYPSRYERWRMRLSALCDSQTFADWNLERLYRKYAFSFDRGLLSRFLLLYIVLLVTLGALDFVANSCQPNERNISHMAVATVFLFAFVFLNCRFIRHRHLIPMSLLVLLLVLVFAVVAFPVDWGSAILSAPTRLHPGRWALGVLFCGAQYLYALSGSYLFRGCNGSAAERGPFRGGHRARVSTSSPGT